MYCEVMDKQIYILGIGHNTPVFMDLALDCGYYIAGLYHYNDERTGEMDYGYKVLGSFNDLFQQDICQKNFLLTMGDIQIRKTLCGQLLKSGGKIPTLIHPTAVISRFAQIDACGVLINAFSHIQANTVIEENVTILSEVIVSHNNVVGAYSFLADKAFVGAYTHVGKNVFFGQGALSISGKVADIGDGAYIGAASLLTKNVPSEAVVCGQPARVIRY